MSGGVTGADETSSAETSGLEAGVASRFARAVVVDDEALTREHLAGLLGELGIEVVGEASDGLAALALCARESPDVVVLDQRMPGVEGLEVAGRLYRELGVPAVMCSAYAETAERMPESGSGVFGFVVKPATLEQLRATLGVAWGRHRETASAAAEAESLRARLEERREVERAKWRVVELGGVGEAEAFRGMQKHARATRRKLGAVASAMLDDESEVRAVIARAQLTGPSRDGAGPSGKGAAPVGGRAGHRRG